MTEQKDSSKRGRKAKTVNFDKKKNNIKEFQINQTFILHIPLKIEELLEGCSNLNEKTDMIEEIFKNAPEIVVPFNQIISEDVNLFQTHQQRNTAEDIQQEIISEHKEYKETDKNGNSVSVKIYENEPLPVGKNKQILKRKTDIVCWWCCHPFDTYPVCAPVKYDGKKDIFKAEGCFCSFNCSKSYLISEIKGKIYLNSQLIKKMKGSIEDVKLAPPRTVLKMFGGPLTIQEYRSSFTNLDTINFNVYPMIFIPNQIEYRKVSDISKKDKNNHQIHSHNKKDTVSVNNVKNSTKRIKNTRKNENIKNESKNSLVNLMNIKIIE